MHYFLLVFFLALPSVSSAAVIISEVAWMGSAISANHEWIELQNTDSTSADVTGWVVSDGMNLNITLEGSISGNSFAVLERTSEASAAGTAFLIYTGALVNTGTTLSITRPGGGLEDQVAGGENWQNIGGDNVTKETAQYTTAGWVTGTATPNSTNSGIPISVDDDNEETDDEVDVDTTSTNTKVHKSSETVRLVLRDVSLQLNVESQSVGYVNQEISFTVKPSGIGDSLADSLLYDWNFGDGTTAYTKEPAHMFSYAGKYVVTVYGGYKRQEQVARHEITILPVSLSLTTNTVGDTQVNNDSPYEIDVSGYRVEGKQAFVFPKYSVILPKQTVTIPKEKIGGSYVRLTDSTGLVLKSGFSLASASISESIDSSSSPLRAVAVTNVADNDSVWISPLLNSAGFVTSVVAAATTTTQSVMSPTPLVLVASTTKPSSIPDATWPYLGLIVIIILGLVGTARKATHNQTD